MKTECFKRQRLVARLTLRATVVAAVLGVILAGPGASLQAAVVLDTLGGGPLQGYPNAAGYIDGNTLLLSQFNQPCGLALNPAGTTMYLADRDNNAVRKISQIGDTANSVTSTFAKTNNGINHPVAVAVDTANRVYVLNRGNGNDGTVLVFNSFGNLLGVKVAGLTNATAIALDGSTNLYVTLRGNAVIRVGATGTNTVGVIAAAGTSLKGIAMLDTGMLALSDAGNHGIWLLNPANGNYSELTGFNGSGDTFGEADFAQFNGPEMIAKAGDGMLVVADRGNHRVKTIDPAGTVRNLYGVSSNYWFLETDYPGWWDGNVCDEDQVGCPEAREPYGVVVGPNGNVYTTEVYYHLFRQVTGTGLTGPGGGGGGGGTNAVTVASPTISPNFGYFPMGRMITVNSPNPDVHYTTDGSVPSQNSPLVTMSGNTGYIRWASSTNDLTSLRVRAFIGTNASATISGVPAPTNSVGIPQGLSGDLFAGVGSRIVVPVVADLRTNDTVKSFIFRVEVQANGSAPIVSDQFTVVSVTSNDFIRVVTAAREGAIGLYNYQPYTTAPKIRGLSISAIGTNANISFQHYGIVAMLEVPIPSSAQVGQTYSINILNSSATSDGGQASVAFPAKPAATIIVTNVPYVVGDCAVGGWYNAGDFGNHDLDNADVNSAFYAATGLRIPYAFTDVYDSMDAWPQDESGFLGGDGELSYLDWQVTLQRALGRDQANWLRARDQFGGLTNASTGLIPGGVSDQGAQTFVAAPWNRQALVAARPVGSATAGSPVNVPVYVRTAYGADVRGLQFTCYLTPENGAPALSSPPSFVPAAGVVAPNQLTTDPGNLACGWSLDSVNFGSHTSNYLGTVRFLVPSDATSGQTYSVSFAKAQGARDLYTPYTFETKRATVFVAAPATAVTDITSDDWKLYYFGSLTDPNANPNADGDHDGVPNWAEYLAGTDPTLPGSVLRFETATTQLANGNRQVVLSWLSAPGKLYEVLGGGTAGSAASVLGAVLGDGTEKQFVDTDPGSQRYYRLRVQP